jgi:hypothetical protein
MILWALQTRSGDYHSSLRSTFTTLSKHHGLCISLSSLLHKDFSVLLNHWLFNNFHQLTVTFQMSCSRLIASLRKYKLQAWQFSALVHL